MNRPKMAINSKNITSWIAPPPISKKMATNTTVHAFKKIPMGKQAHNNYQNPSKCGLGGYDPPSALRLTQNGHIF